MQRILIAEDDAKNNQMLREYLEDHGYTCTQAYSGSEAKLLFELEKFDLVLLDLMLPGISGEELVSVFSKKVPVIVLSAKSGLDSKVEVLSAGAEDYMCKPFDLPELLVHQRGAPADIALVLHRDHGVILPADTDHDFVPHNCSSRRIQVSRSKSL